jgi:AAA15 family ATPase/GTPase
MREKLPHLAVKQFVSTQLFQILHSAFYSEVYVFPTERTGFIIFPFLSTEEAVADTSGAAHGDTPLAHPVKRFLEMIVTSAITSSAKRKGQINDNPKILDYVKLADFLETEILRGKVDFDTSRLHKELLFQPLNNTHKLEMPVVSSSMVKELAPLVLCLRYLVAPNDWIIIDEPEMNLHPAVQIEFIEFLAMLVNAGLQVLITTQSPYIIDHLANLMKAAKLDDKDKIKQLFYLEETDAFISQEQVSIYQFDEGTTREVVDEKGIIDWSTFGNVSSDVSDIYSQ